MAAGARTLDAWFAGTSLAVEVPRGSALPFAKSGEAALAPPGPAKEGIDRPAARLDAPRGPALPLAAGGEAPGGKQGELSPDLRAALAGHAPAPSQAPALRLSQDRRGHPAPARWPSRARPSSLWRGRIAVNVLP